MLKGDGPIQLTVIVLAIVTILAYHNPAEADVLKETAQPLRKLSRGLANSVTGVLEVPLTIQAVGNSKGPVAGVFLGSFLGLGAAVTRTAAGLFELVTFPFSLPGTGYEPILRPEFLLQPENPLENKDGS